MNLKQKTVSGLTWSFIDNLTKLGVTFLVGIILARLLSPREFGLVGMITIFIAVSQSIIDSGFTQALIRKQDCTQKDYSTVFLFNVGVGGIFYFLLFFSSESISKFFNEPELSLIIRILGLSLIINAVTIVQRARLIKAINFKLQTKISFIASFFSGGAGIWLALQGYGVWSLIVKSIVDYSLTSLLLWLWNRWKPTLEFSRLSFKEMFSFGSKLLVSGLIDTIYRNIYLLIIGKYFSASELGFYTRADQFKNLPSQNIAVVIQRVSYPILSSIQDDIPRLKLAYKKLIRSTMFITFVLMILMAAIAKPLIVILIGDKWLPSVEYLQLLCLVGIFYPLHSLNLDMLQVQGRSDLFLRLEIIKKILAIPTIIIGIVYGIKVMIIGMLINTIIAYFLNSFWSGRLIGYSIIEQIKDIIPSFILAIFLGTIVYSIGELNVFTIVTRLILQFVIGFSVFLASAELLQLKDYLYIKDIIISKFN